MSKVHSDENLDWKTYKVLVQVIKDKREELIAEREALPVNAPERTELLLQQLLCTDLNSAMLNIMIPTVKESETEKES